MDAVLSYIINSILKDDAKNLKVKCIEDENEKRFVIRLPKEFRHELIGKNGKVVNCIRDYLRVVSKKFNKKVSIRIDEI